MQVEKDLESFLSEISKTDQQLSSATSDSKAKSNSIFGESN